MPIDPEKYKAAYEACKDKLPPKDAAFEAKMAEWRSCMAANGVNLPEPRDLSQPPTPPDPSDQANMPDPAKVKAALEACKDKLPTGPNGQPIPPPLQFPGMPLPGMPGPGGHCDDDAGQPGNGQPGNGQPGNGQPPSTQVPGDQPSGSQPPSTSQQTKTRLPGPRRAPLNPTVPAI